MCINLEMSLSLPVASEIFSREYGDHCEEIAIFAWNRLIYDDFNNFSKKAITLFLGNQRELI